MEKTHQAEVYEARDERRSSGSLGSFCLVAFCLFMFAAIATIFVISAQTSREASETAAELAELRERIERLHHRISGAVTRRLEKRSLPDDYDADETGQPDGKPVVHDFAYGIDALQPKASLTVYPFSKPRPEQSQHESEQQQGGGQQQQQQQQQLQDGRQQQRRQRPQMPQQQGVQLGTGRRHYPGQGQQQQQQQRQERQHQQTPMPVDPPESVEQPRRSQSSYSRRVNSHRLSRVSSTSATLPDASDNNSLIPDQRPPPPPPRPSPRQRQTQQPFRKIGSSGNADSPFVHLQGRVSVGDASASHLASGLHTSWRRADWCRDDDGFFSLNRAAGQLKVPVTGHYLVYAQVEYMDSHETNGFEIYLDNEPVLSCVASTRGDDESDGNKHNTCYTAAVVKIEQGGLVHVRDKEAGRYSLLHSTGTFFGLAKIS